MSASMHILANTWTPDAGIFVLADSVAKACVILLTAAGIAWVLRNSSAALRHLTWVVALMAVLSVPLLASFLPQTNILPRWISAVQPVARITFDEELLPMRSENDRIGESKISGFVGPSINAPEPTVRFSWKEYIPSLSSIILTVWALGMAFMLTRIGLSRIALGCLIRSAVPLRPGALTDTLNESIHQLGVRRNIHVYVSDRREIPMAWGIFKT